MMNEPAGGHGTAVKTFDSESQRGKMANLFARVIGASPAKPSKPEGHEADEAAQQAKRQTRVGAVSAEERLPTSQTEDDLLDIPAFLRRQAN